MKLISFSLWGSADRYCNGAIKNAKIASTIYKGWQCRFYYRDVPQSVLGELNTYGAELVPCDGDDGMFWRFRPASDTSIERFISRDTDSILNWREKAAVDDWTKSGRSFHIMRDNYYHGMPLMGGMWGCVGGAVHTVIDFDLLLGVEFTTQRQHVVNVGLHVVRHRHVDDFGFSNAVVFVVKQRANKGDGG